MNDDRIDALLATRIPALLLDGELILPGDPRWLEAMLRSEQDVGPAFDRAA